MKHIIQNLAKMGTLFRSEEMCLTQLFLQSDAAYSCISELGELGLVQFRDLNADVSAFQRKYVPELRRCDEMERKLRYLEGELTKADIPSMDNNEDPEAPPLKEQIPLENQLETLESQLREVNANYEQLKSNFLELTQLRHVLNKTQGEIVFFLNSFNRLKSGLTRPSILPNRRQAPNATRRLARRKEYGC